LRTVLHCTVPLYIRDAFAAVYIVTAVMFHSCVVCAVTAGDVVNSQLARLGAMIIVYSMSIVFFILDSVSHVDAVRQSFPKRMRALPKSQLLQQDMQLPRKHRREISYPTPEKTMQPHLCTAADAGLGCEPDAGPVKAIRLRFGSVCFCRPSSILSPQEDTSPPSLSGRLLL
jgi:hypothetical protein